MRYLIKILEYFRQFLKKFGYCGNIGLIIGGIAGFLLTLLNILNGYHLHFTNISALYISLILSGFTWAFMIMTLCVFARLQFRPIALRVLVLSLMTCFALVYFSNGANTFKWAWLTGMVFGLISGYVLCIFEKHSK